MSFICYNGAFLPDTEPGLLASNRSFKWGDGVFETLKVYKGRILLQSYHFERLITSLRLLQMHLPYTIEELTATILTLCARNGCEDLGRVRFAVYRQDNDQAGYTIEAVPIGVEVQEWNTLGYTIDTYPYARKACDALANLKTANYLPYVMADRFAKEHKLQECLILNSYQHICDASKMNVFIVKDQTVFTPALDQGCINGVMRRYIVEEIKKTGRRILQTELTEAMLLEADECFLTNAIQGIRWVGRYRQKQFDNTCTKQIFEKLFSTNYY